MDKEKYAAYLTSDEWKTIAAERRAKDGNTCWICGKVAQQGVCFPVHHLSYERAGGSEELDDLVTVCPFHHEAIHKALDARAVAAKKLRADYNKEVAERIADIDARYVELRAQLIAEAVTEAIADTKPRNINGIISYFEDALKLQCTMHRQLQERKIPNAFQLAMQLVSKLRKSAKKP